MCNCIRVIGTAVTDPEYSHESHDEQFYTFTIEVRRLSGNIDKVPVMISERILGEIEENFIGSRFDISGTYAYENYLFANDIYSGENRDDMNFIEIEGYVCKPPRQRTTPSGRIITDILLAVPRLYGRVDYIPVILWGRDALYGGGLSEGVGLFLQGRVQSRIYRKDDFAKTVYEISCTKIK